jgi:MinD-like ATPase involved in chromosome partitioning or flagellar assembly
MLSDVSLCALEESSLVLWVTSTDFSSINNSLAGLAALEKMSYPEGRIKLVLNVNSSDDGVRPAKIEEVLGRQFFWSIPYDKEVRTGAQIGIPAILGSPGSPGAKALLQLAGAVTGGAPETRPEKKDRKMWPFRRGGDVSATRPAEGG